MPYFLRYPCYTIHELYDMLMCYDDGFATHFHDFVDDANNDTFSLAWVLCPLEVVVVAHVIANAIYC